MYNCFSDLDVTITFQFLNNFSVLMEKVKKTDQNQGKTSAHEGDKWYQ